MSLFLSSKLYSEPNMTKISKANFLKMVKMQIGPFGSKIMRHE